MTRLTLFDKIYRELDKFSAQEKYNYKVKAKTSERYDALSEFKIDGEYITIKAANADRLNLAQQVAEFYGAKFSRGEEAWRRDPEERFFIKIKVD